MKHFIAILCLLGIQILGFIICYLIPNNHFLTEKTFCTLSGMMFMWVIYNWNRK